MEIALNFTLNYPIGQEEGGAPLATQFDGFGSRSEKSEAGSKVRVDLRNINNMPETTISERTYKRSVLEQYLTKIITTADLQNNLPLPGDYLEKTIVFLLKPIRGSMIRSNLIGFVNRPSISNAAFLNQLLIRIRQYLKGVAKNFSKIQKKEISVTRRDEEGNEVQIEFEDIDQMSADDRLELIEEQLTMKIKMTRLSIDEKYFLQIWVMTSLPKMKKYNLLNIPGNSTAESILKKINTKLRKPLNLREQEIFDKYRGTFELEFD